MEVGQVVEFVLVERETLDVDEHVEAAVVSVGLAGQEQLVGRQVALPQLRHHSFAPLQLHLQVLSDRSQDELFLLEHRVAVDQFAL